MGDTLKGYPSKFTEDRTGQTLANINKLNQFEAGLATYAFNLKQISTLTVASATSTEIITTTDHLAREGDVIRFLTGTANNIDVEIVVHEVINATTFSTAQPLLITPVAADTFTLYRPIREVQSSGGGGGDASFAEQQVQTAILTDIETNTTGLATEFTLSVLNAKVIAVDTGAVVISSSALPTGASTSALQAAGNASLATMAGAVINGSQQISKSFNATTTQIGVNIWSPVLGNKIAVTSVVIGTYGTTAGRIILWFGDNANTVYTEGTDQCLLKFSSAPSATSKPGLVFCPSVPVFCNTVDRELHITTDAGISLDVVVHGYEW